VSTLRQAAPDDHIGLRGAPSVEKVYPAVPLTARLARRLVTSALTDWGLPAMRDRAGLVTAELAANAAIQGQAALPGQVLVRVTRTPLYVVIQVGDHNTAGPPEPPLTVADTAENGRGLLISRALSADIGWFLQGEWKIVWAALCETQEPGDREAEASRGRLGRAA
jgi:hypothetical protein